MENLCDCRINKAEKENVEDDGDQRPFDFSFIDPDFFSCPICYQPLTMPVFQCHEEGHIICSSCIRKLAKNDMTNCPSCDEPMGKYLRCRAIEKVIEGLKAHCEIKKTGCKERMQISNRLEHYASCSCFECPLPSCNFAGSYSDWQSHVSQSKPEHVIDVTDFRIGVDFQVTLEKTKRCCILRCQGQKFGIFVLNNFRCRAVGYAFTVSRIGPSYCNSPCYDISVSEFGEPSFKTVSLHSSADCIQKKVTKIHSKTLFVPDGFDLGGTLFLNVRIKELDAHCGNEHQDESW